MLDKYIQIKDRQIICGQNAGGMWYCKELPADNTCELNKLIGEVNSILNTFNKPRVINKKKDKEPEVKGLK